MIIKINFLFYHINIQKNNQKIIMIKIKMKIPDNLKNC